MAQTLYINPNPATMARATLLGCGWMAAVPVQYRSVATAPCVILSGAGQTVVISDSPPTTAAAVASALQPIIDAEATLASASAAQATNRETLQARAQTALTANATFLALASPSNAQTLAQVQTLTKEANALIRLALGLLDSTAGT
jgi:hypothetical protein